jgi:O-methyltransferase
MSLPGLELTQSEHRVAVGTSADAADVAWHPDPLDVSIEIVGACNLTCPACGHGNNANAPRPMGTMGLERFERILDKVEREFHPRRPRIHLFNWGEPLLHPQAPEFVGRVKARGLSCHLSSNLVRPRDLRGVVEARPDWLRVSVSGFTQAVYGQTHRGGDIERVKANMRLLRTYMDELNAPIAVEVNYHLYRHNTGPDYAAMRAFAHELGFAFEPIWSVAGSADKVISWLEHGVPEPDRPHVHRLVHQPEDSREISRRYRHLLPVGECPLRESVLINSDGSVDLCCAVYSLPPVAPNYLEASAEQIRELKRRAPICGPCMEHGLHLTYLSAGRAERDARGLSIVGMLQDRGADPQVAAEHGGPPTGALRSAGSSIPCDGPASRPLAARAARPGVEALRAPGLAPTGTAKGPESASGDIEALRSRYLDIMKRCILNLIYEDEDMLRKQAFLAAARADGRDWPAVAHSMVGQKRLDNVQACAEDVIRRGIPGDLIETGVWRGGATILMRAVLEAYGVRDRRVWVADSFEGLPRPDASKYPADAGDTFHTYPELAIPLESVQANFDRYGLLDDQVRFLKGWFKDTLTRAPIERLAVARLDGDMYESTIDALQALYPKLSIGGYLIIDDYGAVPGCKRAVEDYRQELGITEPIEAIDWTGVYWRRLQ